MLEGANPILVFVSSLLISAALCSVLALLALRREGFDLLAVEITRKEVPAQQGRRQSPALTPVEIQEEVQEVQAAKKLPDLTDLEDDKVDEEPGTEHGEGQQTPKPQNLGPMVCGAEDRESSPINGFFPADADCSPSLLDMIERSLGASPMSVKSRASSSCLSVDPKDTESQCAQAFLAGDKVFVYVRSDPALHGEQESWGSFLVPAGRRLLGAGTIVTVEARGRADNLSTEDVFWVVVGTDCLRCVAAQLRQALREELAAAGLSQQADPDELMRGITAYRDIADNMLPAKTQAAVVPPRKGSKPAVRLKPPAVAPPPDSKCDLPSFESIGLLRKLGLLDDTATKIEEKPPVTSFASLQDRETPSS
eukprot:TRINITY_DN29872_c0_g1_i1.p1 TRINITY_DN29872_c0_g1~~TRINITY_DN29872_c0_g1_i1.p1  ORF type:complete len:366 (-),score=58.47 TRINITY_DN29872_c0_g1_i1:309-1406(-)